MRPCVRVDAAAGLRLDPVVTNRGGRGQRLLDVSALQEAPLARGISPDAGETISLQLLSHRKFVGLIGTLLLKSAHLVADAGDVLSMVCQFVRDNVRLREVPGSPESPPQLLEELKIEVRGLIRRAVKRPHVGAGCSTP